MFHKGFFKGVPKEKIKKIMQEDGFSPKLIKDKPNYIYELHQHPETKYLACLEGSMEVTVKGKTHTFEPGDKLIIPGNTTHSAKVSKQGCIFFRSEKLQYQYFVSSRWRNRDQVLELVEKIRAKGKTVYCFFEANHAVHRVNNDPEKDMQHFEKRNWRMDPYVKEVFDNDMTAEKNSETLIMLLPAGKSAHIEAGAAYGMGKKCILIGEQKEAESLYLIFNESYPTIDDFINSIS